MSETNVTTYIFYSHIFVNNCSTINVHVLFIYCKDDRIKIKNLVNADLFLSALIKVTEYCKTYSSFSNLL